jgi:hypothetical protein
MREILEAASEAMLRGDNPYSDKFYIEHELTLDEVYAMLDTTGIALRSFLSRVNGKDAES